MQLADAVFEPKQKPPEFVLLNTKHTFNGVEPFLENRGVKEWLAPASFGAFRPLGLGLMFGIMPRLKIAF